MKRNLIFAVCLAFSAATALAHPSWGIVFDDRRSIVYISDLETVWKIDRHGHLTVLRKGVAGRHIHELALDREGNLYGPDYTYEPSTKRYEQAIWKITPGGTFSYVIDPTFDFPENMSIWRFAGPKPQLTFEIAAPAGANPNSFGGLMGVSIAPDKSVLVADFKNRQVLRVDSQHRVTKMLTSEKNWSPTGVAAAANGDVYALEFAFLPPRTWLPPRVRRLRSGKIDLVVNLR